MTQEEEFEQWMKFEVLIPIGEKYDPIKSVMALNTYAGIMGLLKSLNNAELALDVASLVHKTTAKMKMESIKMATQGALT